MKTKTGLPVPVIFSLMISVLMSSFSALADDPVRVQDNKIKLSIGAYVVAEADTYFSLTERDVGLGISISPHDTLGTDFEQSVFQLDGSYRFNEEDAVKVSWYKISSSGGNEVSKEFTWLDEDGNEITIGAGSESSSKLDFEIVDLAYLWTFYNSDKVELRASAGLHITRLGIEIEVTNTGTSTKTTGERVAVTIPLPTFGLGVSYHITPQWRWHAQANLFAIRYDDWRGSYSDVEFLLEYQPADNFSVGMGVGSNKLKLTEETSDHIFSFDNRLTGFLFQISTMF
ncbi:MAG: DUF2490 domain-containing protein [Pseudomonadales bacterium]|nr:DUF2490 domain-containing protein [Pseudomonadales bacterium]